MFGSKPRYRLFLRSARNWDEFSKARKRTVRYVHTEADAILACRNYNQNRTSAQIARGTKLEFEHR